jgi:hypothetical protein
MITGGLRFRNADSGKIGDRINGIYKMARHADGRQVIGADHGSKPIPLGTLKSIIEGSKLSPDDFR